jgi:hypothetical protein
MRHQVDWPNLAPDLSDLTKVTFARIMAVPTGNSDHYYFNPAFTVTAPGSVPEGAFLREARRACVLWMKQISRVLSPKIRRKWVKEAELGERALLFSGSLFLQGRPAHIKRLGEATPPVHGPVLSLRQ